MLSSRLLAAERRHLRGCCLTSLSWRQLGRPRVAVAAVATCDDPGGRGSADNGPLDRRWG